ncbi:MAG TPA: 4-(cytidine 5'-diphospho)-2-C-methyl-D-erythritol kinase [bacterium]|nr:4-(cytidine 5'-diphospho)-2-C-methyl-D-erythritol kinase [bacterium]HQG45461.1 4-(cytidine 5'-diphospho)-2-C-methyl-D-erythritol kinase [bacterium]HQI47264.1 4-(cytidine 5'-diphospho)-2-C-methyl-D-erythritol kinase [bacterium]HQJ64227.1 4-(cytidine 5'-diphospho)-2-C-methyl-D-erythritol kinase [bacterium]
MPFPLRHYSAYAKINLGLRILGRRADGYHEVETIYQQISVRDVLSIAAQPSGIVVGCTDPTLPVDGENLAGRAAALLRQHAGVAQGCNIQIQKNIPVGAGLGGGSSDAATALVALNQIWEIGWPLERLAPLAAELGSDVPFFLRGGCALGRGRGEILEPLQLPQGWWGVLVYPNLVISTHWVYENANFSLTKSLKNSKFYSLTGFADRLSEWDLHLANDLEPVVFNRYPHLKELVEGFRRAGAFYAHMSGSGSAIFGLFLDKSDALSALAGTTQGYTTFLFHPIAPRKE